MKEMKAKNYLECTWLVHFSWPFLSPSSKAMYEEGNINKEVTSCWTEFLSSKYVEANFIWVKKNYAFPKITTQSAQIQLGNPPRHWLLMQSNFEPTISKVHVKSLTKCKQKAHNYLLSSVDRRCNTAEMTKASIVFSSFPVEAPCST